MCGGVTELGTLSFAPSVESQVSLRDPVRAHSPAYVCCAFLLTLPTPVSGNSSTISMMSGIA